MEQKESWECFVTPLSGFLLASTVQRWDLKKRHDTKVCKGLPEKGKALPRLRIRGKEHARHPGSLGGLSGKEVKESPTGMLFVDDEFNDTVDGRNPAPPSKRGWLQRLVANPSPPCSMLSLCFGKVVQDFGHSTFFLSTHVPALNIKRGARGYFCISDSSGAGFCPSTVLTKHCSVEANLDQN